MFYNEQKRVRQLKNICAQIKIEVDKEILHKNKHRQKDNFILYTSLIALQYCYQLFENKQINQIINLKIFCV
ncbi:hypothetical protein TTHERM_00925860 (macronuclear) [Tetrahymena thermophila SB210]|uniref:Uncharacterized protein n=1 Tax=Tetrahymena thermophila (strain SB210) TaxID=312017 RepID=Q22DX3_TETTS|nr:hypothetical protein TTHERM_00925860 [Tetrahymena thermophila SB210]EAR83539.1 hypothetical protein TTHERM_00925860 [Tetrahymena thermophila SB210]|eukprot:XP_001031202.1 hypothetical protein TTHERM_00925860 [Tetrahymena thermophila SB210]